MAMPQCSMLLLRLVRGALPRLVVVALLPLSLLLFLLLLLLLPMMMMLLLLFLLLPPQLLQHLYLQYQCPRRPRLISKRRFPWTSVAEKKNAPTNCLTGLPTLVFLHTACRRRPRPRLQTPPPPPPRASGPAERRPPGRAGCRPVSFPRYFPPRSAAVPHLLALPPTLPPPRLLTSVCLFCLSTCWSHLLALPPTLPPPRLLTFAPVCLICLSCLRFHQRCHRRACSLPFACYAFPPDPQNRCGFDDGCVLWVLPS